MFEIQTPLRVRVRGRRTTVPAGKVLSEEQLGEFGVEAGELDALVDCGALKLVGAVREKTLGDHSVPELLAIAEAEGVEIPTGSKRAAIIKAIEAKRAESAKE